MKKLNKRGILELYGINDLGNIDNDKGFTEFVKILSQRCKEIGVNKFVIQGKFIDFNKNGNILKFSVNKMKF